jgi:hypothetical protein
LSEKVGFEIERKAEPAPMGGFGEDPTAKQDPKDPKEPAEEDDEKPKEDPMGLSASQPWPSTRS